MLLRTMFLEPSLLFLSPAPYCIFISRGGLNRYREFIMEGKSSLDTKTTCNFNKVARKRTSHTMNGTKSSTSRLSQLVFSRKVFTASKALRCAVTL